MTNQTSNVNFCSSRFIFTLLLLLSVISHLAASDNTAQQEKPLVSIITSVWNGDEFIEGFLADITKQTIFTQCELIIINANSPGNEEPIIKEYQARYPNILYSRLSEDPGLYSVWNEAIKTAKADFISNANLDDRSRYDHLEAHIKELQADPSIDLVYAGHYLTEYPNETFDMAHYQWFVEPPEFSIEAMQRCLTGPRPVWRKSIHTRFGFFDQAYPTGGDQEMWLRAVAGGAKFKKIPGFYTLYYLNPKGLSTDRDEKKTCKRWEEGSKIVTKYLDLWKPPATGE